MEELNNAVEILSLKNSVETLETKVKNVEPIVYENKKVILTNNEELTQKINLATTNIDTKLNTMKNIVEPLKSNVESYNSANDVKIKTLSNTVYDTVKNFDNLKEYVISNLGEIENISSQMVDKMNKTDVLSMANMGQDVKEAMTGGSVAVVGINAVCTENIKDNQVTVEKTNFLTTTMENYLLNNSGRYVTQSGAIFSTSDTTTNRCLFTVYLEPNTTYNLICPTSNISFYLLEIYNDTEKISTLAQSSAIVMSRGITFNTDEIKKGEYKLLIREVNSFSYDIANLKFKLSKNKSFIDNTFSDVLKIHFDNFVITENNLGEIIDNWNIRPTVWRENIALWTDGGETVDTSRDTTYFIPCLENINYFINENLWCCFYDSSFEIIGERQVVQSSHVLGERAFVFSPLGAKYIRFSVLKTVDKNNIICVPVMEKVAPTKEQANRKVFSPTMLPQLNKKNWYRGKKLVTDGDSLVAMSRWQQALANDLEMVVHANIGIGGTKVTHMCLDERVNNIPVDTEVLILWAGTNDWGQTNNATPIGNIDDEHNNKTYYGAYQLWLDKIFEKIPTAKKLICIPSYRKDEGANHLGYTLEEYRVATRNIAYKYGVPIIDLKAEMGVNSFNHATYFEDAVHINTEGGNLVASLISGKLKSIEPLL